MFDINNLDIDDTTNLQSSYAVHKLDIGIYKAKMYLKKPQEQGKSYCEVCFKIDPESIHTKFQGAEISHTLFMQPYTNNMSDADSKREVAKFRTKWKIILCSNYNYEDIPPFDYKKVIEKDRTEFNKYKNYMIEQQRKFSNGEYMNCYIQVQGINFAVSGKSIYPRYTINILRNVHALPEEVLTETYEDYLETYILKNKKVEYRAPGEPSQYVAFDETDLTKDNLLTLTTALKQDNSPKPTETTSQIMDSIEDIPF